MSIVHRATIAAQSLGLRFQGLPPALPLFDLVRFDELRYTFSGNRSHPSNYSEAASTRSRALEDVPESERQFVKGETVGTEAVHERFGTDE